MNIYTPLARIFPSFFIIFLAVSLPLISCEGTQKKESGTSLSLTLNKGATYQLSSITEQNISQTVMGVPNDTEQEIGLYYDFIVDDIQGGNYEITTRYTRVKFRASGPAGEADYDSETTPKDSISTLATGYAALVGQTFHMTVTPAGKVLEIKDLNAFLDGLAKNLEELSPGIGEDARKLLADQFGEETLKQSIENITSHFPPKSVNVGDSWDSNYDVTQGFSLNVQNTYTLKKVEAGKAYIDAVSTLQSDPEKSMNLQGVNMNYDLKGDQTTTIVVDLETGWTESAISEQQVDGNVTVTSDQIPQPMTWPMNLETKITLTSQIK